eukprot:3182434-Prymnesium_polylepis.4
MSMSMSMSCVRAWGGGACAWRWRAGGYAGGRTSAAAQVRTARPSSAPTCWCPSVTRWPRGRF